MKVNPSDIVDTTFIARQAKVRTSAVWNWRMRHADFPKPLPTNTKSPLWYWPDVAKWLGIA